MVFTLIYKILVQFLAHGEYIVEVREGDGGDGGEDAPPESQFMVCQFYSLPCSRSWPYYNSLSSLTRILQQCSNCPLCFLPPFFIIYLPHHSLTVTFKFKCIHFSA